jgi:hypothetical protein
MENLLERNFTPIILSSEAREYLGMEIRKVGWDNESIASAFGMPAYGEFVRRIREGNVTEIGFEQQTERLVFYSLLTFLGISKDKVLSM